LLLELVVGSNGAGKTTFVDRTLMRRSPDSIFVNADVIAKQRWPHDPEGQSYEAARIAEQTRSELIARGTPFIAETVFSHPSKLDLIAQAQAAGYHVALHVLLIPCELAVARVRSRVAAGGHSVPEAKIRERYDRLWPLVARAVTSSDTAAVYDNSRVIGPQRVAEFTVGVAIGAPQWPAWTPPILTRLG
jgi:predicted ABC-type ATPase